MESGNRIARLQVEIPTRYKRHAYAYVRLLTILPRYRGGLVPGDVVVQINGLPVESSNAVYRALEKHNVLEIKIYRGNAYSDLVIYPEDVS